MSEQAQLNEDAVTEMAERIGNFATGQFVSMMIHIGDRLKLYSIMNQNGKLNAAELSQKTGLQERWLLEWLRSQAGAGLIQHHDNEEFSLYPEVVPLLVDESHPMHQAAFFNHPVPPSTMDRIAEAFDSGLGMSYEDHGPNCACTLKRLTAPDHLLLTEFLNRIGGITNRLEEGINVVDVGCGAGVALCELSKRFPNSTYEGYDPSVSSIDSARLDLIHNGMTNITYHVAKGEDLPQTAQFDLALTLDCLHDLPFPQQVLNAIRGTLKPDGVLIVKDIRCSPETAENLAHPMSPLLYSISVLYCMNSALSEPNGAGLGTMGLNPVLLQEMGGQAGFTQFEQFEFEEDPFNYFYALRP